MDRYFWFCYQTEKQPHRNVELFCWFSHDCTLKLIENVWINLSRNVLDHLLYDFLGDFLEHFWTMFWKSFGCFGLQVVEKETIHLNKGQNRIFLWIWYWFQKSHYSHKNSMLKVGFFQKVRFVFQISKSPNKNIPKNYPELEI